MREVPFPNVMNTFARTKINDMVNAFEVYDYKTPNVDAGMMTWKIEREKKCMKLNDVKWFDSEKCIVEEEHSLYDDNFGVKKILQRHICIPVVCVNVQQPIDSIMDKYPFRCTNKSTGGRTKYVILNYAKCWILSMLCCILGVIIIFQCDFFKYDMKLCQLYFWHWQHICTLLSIKML